MTRIRRLGIPQSIYLAWFETWSGLLQAGLPVVEALQMSIDLLPRRGWGPRLQQRLMRVHLRLQSGQTLCDAFVMDAQPWPKPIIQAVFAGQHSGRLAAMTLKYLQHWQKQRAVQSELWRSLMYPLTVVLITALAVWMLNTQLPTAQQAAETSADSDWLEGTSLWMGLTSLVGLLIALLNMRRQKGKGQLASVFDSGALTLWSDWHLSHYFFDLANGLQAGMDLMGLLKLNNARSLRPAFTGHLSSSTQRLNSQLERALHDGQSLSRALTSCGAPDFLLRQAAVAEKSGDLAACFELAARVFETQAQQRQNRIKATLGPLVLALSALTLTLSFQVHLAPLYGS